MKTPAQIAEELVRADEYDLFVGSTEVATFRNPERACAKAEELRSIIVAAIDADRTQRAISVPGGISAERLAVLRNWDAMVTDAPIGSWTLERRDLLAHIDHLEDILHLFHDEEAAAYCAGYDAGKRAGWREAKAACVKAASEEAEGDGSLAVAEWRRAVKRTIDAVSAVSDTPREG